MKTVRRFIAVRYLTIAVVALLLGAACSGTSSAQELESEFEGLLVTDPPTLPDLVLTDTDGNFFDLVADTQGDVAMLYFGFTHCPDICNIQLNQISQVLARPGAPTNVTVLFVSVDPERDTPAVIRRYLNNFSTDFVGLLADEATLTQLQNDVGALAAIRLDQPADEVRTPPHTHSGDETHSHDHDSAANDDATNGSFQPGTVNYEVGHDARFFAFAPNNVGYTQYPHPTRQSQFAHDLPLLAAIAAQDSSGRDT